MGNICCKKETEKTKPPPYFEENEIVLTKPRMGTRKPIRITNEEYLIVAPRIAFYLINKNISAIFKYKCPLFTAGGVNGRIYLFSISLEHMGTFVGHKGPIRSLCAISNKILASGSMDANIKIWDIEERIIKITTLSGHRSTVTALCYVREGQLVSGSWDNSLIIWSKFPGSSSNYSQKQVLTGHRSGIRGIIRINNREIISGEWDGDLKIWNIDEGVCIRHIPSLGGRYLTQMKQHIGGDVAISYYEKIFVLGAVNNWKAPIKQFSICDGWSIEFLDRDLLFGGGSYGQLEFIDYTQTGCSMPPDIQGLHSRYIEAIQRIAKNILATSSDVDGYIKVIDPISRKCYLKFRINSHWRASVIAYFY